MAAVGLFKIESVFKKIHCEVVEFLVELLLRFIFAYIMIKGIQNLYFSESYAPIHYRPGKIFSIGRLEIGRIWPRKLVNFWKYRFPNNMGQNQRVKVGRLWPKIFSNLFRYICLRICKKISIGHVPASKFSKIWNFS